MAITTSYNCQCSDEAGTEYKTLAELRSDMMHLLGWGAMAANPPPGVEEMLTLWLQNAQKLLYGRFNQLHTERFFSWPLQQGVNLYDFPDNAEAAVIPTPSAPTVSNSGVGGTLPAGLKSYRIAAVNVRGVTLASVAGTTTTAGATSTATITFPALPVVPDGADEQTGWRVYGRTAGGELLLASVGLVADWTDDGSLTPAGALPTANTTYICNKRLDPLKLTWVGLEQNNSWMPLREGIDPTLYGFGTTGYPARYEIGSCIQVWPTPEDEPANLVIKGHFGLQRFSEPTDQTTIDSLMVFSLAMAKAKRHYRQSDAGDYASEADQIMRDLVAGGHGTRRYVPGYRGNEDYIYTQPKPTVPFPNT